MLIVIVIYSVAYPGFEQGRPTGDLQGCRELEPRREQRPGSANVTEDMDVVSDCVGGTATQEHDSGDEAHKSASVTRGQEAVGTGGSTSPGMGESDSITELPRSA